MAVSNQSIEDKWVAQTVKLLRSVQDHYDRLETRITRLQREQTDVRCTLETLQHALDIYVREMKLPRSAIPELPGSAGAGGATKYHGLKPREMLLAWAEDHDGQVVMNDAVKAMVAAGNFADTRRAAGNLYATMQRMAQAGDFIKASDQRGVYFRPDGSALPAVPVDAHVWLNTNRPMATSASTPTNNDDPGDLPFAMTNGSVRYDDASDLEDLPF